MAEALRMLAVPPDAPDAPTSRRSMRAPEVQGGGMSVARHRPLRALRSSQRSLRSACPITRLATDSRRVQPGDIFVAYPGERTTAARFIPQAIAAGAARVLWEADGFHWDPPGACRTLRCRDLRAQLGAHRRARLRRSVARSCGCGRDRHQRQDLVLPLDRAVA